MWVRLWWRGSYAEAPGEEESTYHLLTGNESDDSLEDMAKENIPDWAHNAERSVYCGFERLAVLPQAVRTRMRLECQTAIRARQYLLATLDKEEEEANRDTTLI